MQEPAEILGQLSTWYGTGGRSFIEEHLPERVQALDGDMERLQKTLRSQEKDLAVCFLGTSGVGKSTLINVLVAEGAQVLPQGGVGPLTAQATLVRRADVPSFKATYLPAKYFNWMLFALERYHESELRRAGSQSEADARAVSDTLDADALLEFEATLETSPTDSAEEQTSSNEKLEAYAKRVNLLVRGNQFGELDLPYLIDSLSECLGRDRKMGTAPIEEDRPRLERLKQAIAFARDERPFEFEGGADRSAFLQELGLHASGFLAPSIRTLEVFVDAPCLRNQLVLVDLPGLGIANDEYQSVTSRWIREARAVVLVVDRAGIAESSAALLQSTGYLTGLLHDSHDTEVEPKSLMVAVVKLDMSASDQRNYDKSMAPGTAVRPWAKYFDEVCGRAEQTVRAQLEAELRKLLEAGGDAARAERALVVERVLQSLQVHPVSALDYRRFVLQDEDEPARIADVEVSRIPRLRRALEELAVERRTHLLERLGQAESALRDQLVAAVSFVLAKWEQDDRAAEEVERLREDLEVVAAPLRKEFYHRQGEFRNFLTHTVPAVINDAVNKACMEALKDIRKYLKKLRGCHWATVRAAVRRGGAYDGARHIDIPVELAQALEAPIAVGWSQDVLTSMRRRTRAVGAEYTNLVRQLVEWARGQGTRVKPAAVELLFDSYKAQAKGLEHVGKDAIDEVKERVRVELADAIEVCVRKRCEKFVRSKRDVGTGVKSRMEEFLEGELAEAVIEAAMPVAKEVLTRNFREAAAEIREKFKGIDDPVEASIAAIVGGEEERLRRSDAQKRKQILGRGRELLDALPPVSEAN